MWHSSFPTGETVSADPDISSLLRVNIEAILRKRLALNIISHAGISDATI